MCDKSHDNDQYNQYTRPNRTSSFNEKRMFNEDVAWNHAMESCCCITIRAK